MSKALGARIQTLREGERLSQAELAFKIGRHCTYISGVERGKIMPPIHVLAAISKTLNAHMPELLELSPSSSKVGAIIEKAFGVDVSDMNASVDEVAMIRAYRKLKPDARNFIRIALLGAK